MSLLNEKISRERISDLEDHLAQAANNDLNSVHLPDWQYQIILKT